MPLKMLQLLSSSCLRSGTGPSVKMLSIVWKL